jgi:hypothetical protein
MEVDITPRKMTIAAIRLMKLGFDVGMFRIRRYDVAENGLRHIETREVEVNYCFTI